jgi:hypothetical protein
MECPAFREDKDIKTKVVTTVDDKDFRIRTVASFPTLESEDLGYDQGMSLRKLYFTKYNIRFRSSEKLYFLESIIIRTDQIECWIENIKVKKTKKKAPVLIVDDASDDEEEKSPSRVQSNPWGSPSAKKTRRSVKPLTSSVVSTPKAQKKRVSPCLKPDLKEKEKKAEEKEKKVRRVKPKKCGWEVAGEKESKKIADRAERKRMKEIRRATWLKYNPQGEEEEN